MSRRRSTLAQSALLVVAVLLVFGLVDIALAQPFGMTRPQGASEIGGLTGWILAKQAEFYRMMSGTIRAAKADGSAAWTLMAISFLYGVFHAAGPGHGKAVISSYLVANQETARRGIALGGAGCWATLLPVVGLVGAREAAATDRYLYQPLMGILLVVVMGRHRSAEQEEERASAALSTASSPEPVMAPIAIEGDLASLGRSLGDMATELEATRAAEARSAAALPAGPAPVLEAVPVPV